MAWLKAELHTHSKEDPKDDIDYDVFGLIDNAASLGYDVLAVTLHERVLEGKKFNAASAYARSRGLLLIPGCEACIEGKHVLLYNITESERKRIRDFDDLRKMREEWHSKGRNALVVAAHPYFWILPGTALGKMLESNIELFDALEYHYFYTRIFNLNKKMPVLSKRYKKPLLGNCDVHFLENMGSTYTLINADKSIDDVIKAIKNGKIKLKSKPIAFLKMLFTALRHMISG